MSVLFATTSYFTVMRGDYTIYHDTFFCCCCDWSYTLKLPSDVGGAFTESIEPQIDEGTVSEV